MKPLTNLAQLKIGTRLKIVGKNEKDNYSSVSVKNIVDNGFGPEVIIHRYRNYHFNVLLFLNGKSSWVKEVYVLDGLDKRLKAVKNNGKK